MAWVEFRGRGTRPAGVITLTSARYISLSTAMYPILDGHEQVRIFHDEAGRIGIRPADEPSLATRALTASGARGHNVQLSLYGVTKHLDYHPGQRFVVTTEGDMLILTPIKEGQA